MKTRTLPLLLCGLCIAHLPAVAQNITTLPTSMYGIGELNANDGGRYSGLGNMGIALNRPGFQNTQNPAAITRMDTTCFTFDVGITAAHSRYSFLSAHSSSFSGNPSRFSMGFRVLPRWYALVGVAPYSSVGYVIQTEEQIEGTANSATYSSFEGTGGLYKFYVTNAFALTRHLSVGANIGFISGTVNQSETQENGLTYSNSSTTEGVEDSYRQRAQYLPQRLGAGVSMTTQRWVLTADYNYVDWSRNSSSYTSMKYQNQHKVNLGGIFTTNPRLPRSTELMGGVGYSDSYIMLKGGKMQYLEASAGVSFPIRYSYLSLGATWRKQLNSRSNMMQESRWSVNLNLTFGERLSKAKLK